MPHISFLLGQTVNMGAVLAIVIDVVVTVIAAVAEAAATEAAAALVEVGVESVLEGTEVAITATEAAAEAGAEAAAEGAAEAAADAAAEITSSTAEQIAARILTYVAKLSKLIKEICGIDAIFKAAKEVLKRILHDRSFAEKYKKLETAVSLLEKLNKKMNEIMDWLEAHKNDSVELEGIDVPLESGVLATFLKQLSMVIHEVYIHRHGYFFQQERARTLLLIRTLEFLLLIMIDSDW